MIRHATLPLTDLGEPSSNGPSPCSASSAKGVPCPVCPFLDAAFDDYREEIRLKALLGKARLGEQELLERVAELEAELRLRKDQLFGKKPDAVPDAPPPAPKPKPERSPRKAPPRRDYSHLPAEAVVLELPPQQRLCSCCGEPFLDFEGTQDSTVLEIDVRACRRVYRRKRYRPSCSCPAQPGIVTAKAPPKVLPKSLPGIWVWVDLLLDKFLFYRSTHRCLQDLATFDLDLSAATVNDGLQRLVPLFEPLHEALIEHNQSQTHWHADETRWMVFVTLEGKTGHQWYLWVFHAKDCVVFILASGRSREVPEDHLEEVQEGILNGDRYSAYKAAEAVKEGRVTLAFCWAHVRRDFVTLARTRAEHRDWAQGWVDRIGVLYERNRERLLVREDALAFDEKDFALREQVKAMSALMREELDGCKLADKPRGLLESMGFHWQGLTVFVDHPDAPMDYDQAERDLRGPVVGRKN